MQIIPLNLDSVLLLLHNSKLAYLIRRLFAQGDWVLINILYITYISSSGSHVGSIPNHCQKNQGDESEREKELNSTSIRVSKLQKSWHIATSSRTQESTKPEFQLLALTTNLSLN